MFFLEGRRFCGGRLGCVPRMVGFAIAGEAHVHVGVSCGEA